ncbi:MAG: gliding motility-associated C-terminal domain-containing protein [Chitinophagaceae bacterium]|nr:gliding motility-associated C-terminal domain-containing protein [Chitinophagaceae bacterium]
MEKLTKFLAYLIFSFLPSYGIGQTAGFTTPDTVCISQPVNITNISSASSYYWNFCVADILHTSPVGENLGNVGGVISWPVFSDFVEYNGNFYVFVVNHFGASFGIARLDFGNSLLNTPTGVDLGNFNNILRERLEGIQIINEGGNWYAFIVGGDPDEGNVPQLVRIDFGTNIANPNPIATDLGNIGGMYQPLDLYMFKENGLWHGFTVNKNGSLTRFEFANGLENVPNTQNYPLGLNYPTGVNVINENGDFFVFVTVHNSNSIARLDFGNSLLNTPIVNNLGNPSNVIYKPRDITILRFCDAIVGFVVNSPGNSDLIRLDFHNNLEGVPDGISLGNMNGDLSFPHSLSRLFRVDSNVYTFITNVDNKTITRVQFPGCTNSSIPSSTLPVPPPIFYDAPGVYNINLTIDDGLPTQSSFCRQVVVVPEPVHTPLQTILLSPGGSVKIGTGNISGGYQWNATNENTDSITVDQEGLYFVETTGYGCHNVDSFRIVFTTADFSFQQDPCNPLSITFKNETPGSTVIDWDFGNGQHAPGNPNPPISYNSFNNYDVTLYITNASGYNESVTKSIAVEVQTDSLIITRDTTICEGMGIQLNAIGALSYCWTPAQSLSATDIANPVATPATTTTYYLNSLVVGSNIITNGNFSAGNTGFTSEYNYASANITEGQYFVGTNPQAWNVNFKSSCTGHTGSGNMMMVNGMPTADAKVWSQTVAVIPNTNYAFSTWIQSLFNDNPAQLMFSINGITIGNTITASLPVCNWTEFYATWNSGNSTTAVISIVNKNTIVWGNDFALDDISFAPVTIKRDSVIITVEKPVITARADTTICEGITVQLNVTGTADSYQWSPATGLSETSVANPLATPAATTAYIVTGTTLYGCEAKDTVVIIVNPAPEVRSVNDTLLCGPGSVTLTTTGNAVSHVWSPADGLSNVHIASPVASPPVTTQYIVTVMSGEGCSANDTVNITVSDAVVINVSNDTLICEGSSAQLQASGNANFYSWTPVAGLSDPSIANPVAKPLAATQYILEASTIEGCVGKDTVNIAVNPAPVISLTDNTIICPNTSIRLLATGGLSYQWHTSSTLSAHDIPDPYASPSLSTTYIVDVTDGNNCTSTDSVTIVVRNYPVFTASADTTICEGAGATLFAGGGDVYQWMPATGLNDPLSASPIAAPAASTQYSVYISENTCGIDTTINIGVNVSPTPQVTARKSNDINCVDRASQLTVTGASSYTWSPALHLDNAQRSNPVAILDTTTLFTVKGVNEHGCSATDTITVKVTAEGNPLFLLPNVFTPNNDGINDCFGLSKWGIIQLQEFSIYNRWGEKVFSTSNPNVCWNGIYKGIEQQSGTFVYVVRARTFCGAIDRKGTITLIR